jgi:molybdenum-dependent DNA-binding transcriptional regulator ModE
MSDHLFALRLFARVARKASLSAAGRELGIPQSTGSRTIAELERRMGAALLIRNTRAVTLTDAGADFLSRVEPVLAELEDAEQAVRGTGELRGALRVSLGSSLAVREVMPRLPGFLQRHPALQICAAVGDMHCVHPAKLGIGVLGAVTFRLGAKALPVDRCPSHRTRIGNRCLFAQRQAVPNSVGSKILIQGSDSRN